MIQLRSLRRLAAAATMLLAGAAGSLQAQGVTTGAISGVVTDQSGQGVENAQIQVTNTSTGYSTGAITRKDGHYYVQGLEVGGPYTVVVRLLGYAPQTRDNLRLSLGQNLVVDFAIHEQAAQLAGVTVTAESNPVFSPSNKGVATTVSDSALRRLPSLDRNFTDFVNFTPQVTTAGPGLSGGGVNNRYNSIQIDGTNATDLFGLGSTGQPGGQANGKSIPIDAVKEYQVLLTPFDVRQGNFAGVLVNAVTQSGTNDLKATASYFMRNDNLARSEDFLQQYTKKQFGLSLGGPIVKDKIHFFVATEFTRQTSPAVGPYMGQPASATPPLPVDPADVQRFQAILDSMGIKSGSPGLFNRKNPLSNFFGRLDFDLSSNSRLKVTYNYAQAQSDFFSRSSFSFPLTSNGYSINSSTNSPSAQLITNFRNGAENELQLTYNRIRDNRPPNALSPMITVKGTAGGASLVAGADRYSMGNHLYQDIIELKDDYTYPIGSHRITIGTQNQFYKIANLFDRDSYGVYSFGNLDSLAMGKPYAYSVSEDIGGGIEVHMKAAQYAFYAQDNWQATPNFSLTYGLRADIPVLNSKPAETQLVLDSLGRNTSVVPSGNIEWSPRVGFNWDVTGDQKNQLRGGVGMFVGHPAYVWLSNAYQNSGSGLGLLSCTTTRTGYSGAGPAPDFSADPNNQPQTCANGAGLSSYLSEVDLLSKNLKFPQTLRFTLGYDRALPLGLIGTVEGMYTRNLNDFFYINRNLAGPVGTDVNGRVMYGTLAANGQPSPALVSRAFGNVIEAVNTSRNYSWNVTGQLQKRFSQHWEATAAYTYSQARDAQSPTSSQAISNWRYGRELSGNHLDRTPGISNFDQPHKIVFTGTYTFPTKTDLSLTYIGQSGEAFDYVYGGSRGDMNADGVYGNDLIYVPTNVNDTTQIVFANDSRYGTPAEQAAAFDKFINSSSCLSSQRGKILSRNSCRSPWQNIMNVSLRQRLPDVNGHQLAIQLDVYNFLNLLNKNWGLIKYPSSYSNVELIEHVGETSTVAGQQMPILKFDPQTVQFDSQNLASNYQIQLAVRYSFY